MAGSKSLVTFFCRLHFGAIFVVAVVALTVFEAALVALAIFVATLCDVVCYVF